MCACTCARAHTHTLNSYRNKLMDGWIGVVLNKTPMKNLFIFKIASDLSGPMEQSFSD